MFCCEYKCEMNSCLENIVSFEVIKDGQTFKFDKFQKNFLSIKNNLKQFFDLSNIMPAFGVSLHTETLNAIKKETWLKINFEKEMEINGLKFSSLLFKLEKTFGVNLIRLYNNKYDGRCIYLNFNEEVDLLRLLD